MAIEPGKQYILLNNNSTDVWKVNTVIGENLFFMQNISTGEVITCMKENNVYNFVEI